jgi:hypothetical protein
MRTKLALGASLSQRLRRRSRVCSDCRAVRVYAGHDGCQPRAKPGQQAQGSGGCSCCQRMR